MTTNTYNGWTNYETWAVNLWIDNEQNSQEYWREQPVFKAAENTVYADLLNAALGEVNWYEIADSLLEDSCEDSENPYEPMKAAK